MTGWASEMLVETTLLMLAVLLLRWPVRRAFGAKAAYLLWLAPALRLVLPAIPIDLPMPEMQIETMAGVAGTRATLPGPAQWTWLLLAAWLGGAAAFLSVQVWRYRRFLKQALAEAQPVATPGIHDAAVLETSAVSGPAAAGLLIRRVFVPTRFAETFGDDCRALALEHEILHHRRGDLWACAAALGFLSLHWWNPIAYLAHRAFRSDVEAACDADVLEAGGRDRETYAQTLLRCVAQPMPQPTCALTNLSELKGRLYMLSLNHSQARRRIGATLCTAFAGSALLFAIPAGAQDADKEKVEKIEIRRVVKDGKVVEESNIPADVRARMEQCEGEVFEADASSDDQKKKTRIRLCAKPGSSKADMAAMLEEALGRMEGTSELPAENKAEIIARMKARIAELKSGS